MAILWSDDCLSCLCNLPHSLGQHHQEVERARAEQQAQARTRDGSASNKIYILRFHWDAFDQVGARLMKLGRKVLRAFHVGEEDDLIIEVWYTR